MRTSGKLRPYTGDQRTAGTLRTFPPHNQCFRELPTVSNSRIKKAPCFAQPALAWNENRFHQNVRPLSLKRPRIIPSLAQGLSAQALELGMHILTSRST